MIRRVVHLSTVHSSLDPRIRLKQLQSISTSGLTAILVCTDPAVETLRDDVLVERVIPRKPGRLRRVFLVAPRVVWRALMIRAVVYHFHDPELLPWAWVLLLRGVPVVYDVHEDYSRAVLERRYIPGVLRRPLSMCVALVERILAFPFRLIIAERCYRQRFPRAETILNYPRESLLRAGPSLNTGSRSLLYTGNVTVERGALHLVRVIRHVPEVELTMVGRCSPVTAERVRREAGAGNGRLRIIGENRYVPFSEIESYYLRGDWLAGIVLVPDTPHYRDKQLTKFFEFMAVGLPIIATDVPVWRKLIVDQGVGICVNPEDPAGVRDAVAWLQRNPEQAEEMSARGRILVRKQYHWEIEARRLLSYYWK